MNAIEEFGFGLCFYCFHESRFGYYRLLGFRDYCSVLMVPKRRTSISIAECILYVLVVSFITENVHVVYFTCKYTSRV